MKHISNCVAVAKFVFVVMAIASSSLLAQESQETLPGLALLKPTFNGEQRIELAKKMLEPIRLKATTDLSSDERKSFFTQHWAEIDPAWTAKFILENPVPQNRSDGSGALYDNTAIRALMARPTEIAEEDLLKLIDFDVYSWMGGHYATVAIEHLPARHTELKEKLIRIAVKEPKDKSTVSPMMFGNQIKLAKLSSDPAVLKSIEDRITEYYESGEAMKAWKMVRKQRHFSDNPGHYQSMFTRFAPESWQDKFGTRSKSSSEFDVHILVHDEFASDESKRERLHQIKKHSFGPQPRDQMEAANSLGMIATIDHQLALKWAEQAPAKHVQVWAKLAIAPSVVRKDPAAARKLIVDCYEQISMLDASARNRYNYNFSPTQLATRGLQIVEYVDPNLLANCIDTTIATITSLESSQMNSAQNHIFHAVAAIAAFDRVKAESIFEKHSEDVPIGISASFFRALLALHPEQIWDELQDMPEKDGRGIDYRISIRNELLPALTKRSDVDFWRQLNWSGFFALDEKIFADPE